MSRLDSAIRRLMAQRSCLDHAAEMIAGLPGHVLEFGLGNGRTYDHLRGLLPDREIYVFEREVRAHPDCIPDAAHLFEGDLHDTVDEAVSRLGAAAALLHMDIGTGDEARNARFAGWLSAAVGPLLASGAIVLSDQQLALQGAEALPLPDGVQAGRYYFYRFGG